REASRHRLLDDRSGYNADQRDAAYAPARQSDGVQGRFPRRQERNGAQRAELRLRLADGLLLQEADRDSERIEVRGHGDLRQFSEEQVQPQRERRYSLGRPDLRRHDDRLAGIYRGPEEREERYREQRRRFWREVAFIVAGTSGEGLGSTRFCIRSRERNLVAFIFQRPSTPGKDQ